jgi:hypothetical protein
MFNEMSGGDSNNILGISKLINPQNISKGNNGGASALKQKELEVLSSFSDISIDAKALNDIDGHGDSRAYDEELKNSETSLMDKSPEEIAKMMGIDINLDKIPETENKKFSFDFNLDNFDNSYDRGGGGSGGSVRGGSGGSVRGGGGGSVFRETRNTFDFGGDTNSNYNNNVTMTTMTTMPTMPTERPQQIPPPPNVFGNNDMAMFNLSNTAHLSSSHNTHNAHNAHNAPMTNTKNTISNAQRDAQRDGMSNPALFKKDESGEEAYNYNFFQEEEIRNKKITLLEEIAMLKDFLESEGENVSKIPNVDENSHLKEIEYTYKILKIKKDRAHFNTATEDLIMLFVHILEAIFDGTRSFLGQKIDLKGVSTIIKPRLHRLRYETSQIVSAIISNYNIGYGVRLCLELIPAIFFYSLSRSMVKKKNHSKQNLQDNLEKLNSL